MPISVATGFDLEVEGNLFLVGIITKMRMPNGIPAKLVVSGVAAPYPEDLLSMFAFQGTLMVTTADQCRSYQHYLIEIVSFVQSLAVDDSVSDDGGLTGTRANRYELRQNLAGTLHTFLSFVAECHIDSKMVLECDFVKGVTVSPVKGIHMRFKMNRYLTLCSRRKNSVRPDSFSLKMVDGHIDCVMEVSCPLLLLLISKFSSSLSKGWF